MPDDAEAILRVLSIKRRNPDKGLILIASTRQQLDEWVDPDGSLIPAADPTQPITWVAPAKSSVSPLLRGHHRTLAVRLTTNPTAAAICAAVDSPIVSTSANLAGQPVARNRFVLRRKFRGCVDYIAPGHCGPSSGPSEIRDLATGKVLRPGTA
jgi:L-threonylcarbamoyladenylate synthase